MSKGDDLWRTRDMIVLMLYDRGAFYDKAAVRSQAAFKSEVMDKAKESSADVSAADVEELFGMLAWEGLIAGWSGGGGDPLLLTYKGFELGREISAHKGGEPYY